MQRFSPLVLAVLLLASPVVAQDSQYWNNQFGTKAELLGGLVVGSTSDISAAFYNPAWLAVGTDASLLLTTRALEYSSLEIRNAVGSGENAKHTQFRPSPGFLGGQFGKREDKIWNVTWVYLERTKFRFEGSARAVDASPAEPPSNSLWFAGEAFRQAENNESWYGAAFSRMIGENTAFGISPYVAYHSQSQRIQAMAQGVDAANAYADLYWVEEMSYWHFRALAKLGLAFNYRPISFGLAVTTPSLGILGSGDVYDNTSFSGIDTDGDGNPDPYLAVTNQEGLDARWKSPLSVAAGASWTFGDTRIHVTAEWFDAVEGYDVISTDPYQSQSDGETLELNHRLHQRSLVNYGIGVDHRFTERLAAYAAFRSDYTTQPERPASRVLMSTWNLWHLTGGASFQFFGIELTAGLEYTFGDGTSYQPMNFAQSENPESVLSDLRTDVTYDRFKLLIGFDLAVLVNGN